jgi:Na+/melibiose symporter-like transporter
MAEAPVKNQVILNEEDNIMLPEKELLAFGMGGFSINITFIYMIAFVQFYWTDILKVPATTVGAYMIVAKVWDALNDLIVAFFVDRSHWKKGFYVPWQWSFIPMIIFSVLTMTNGSGGKGMIIFSFVVYFFYTLSETFWEVPNMSSQSTMTLNYRCRGKLTAHRQFFGNLAASVVTITVIPLAMKLGGGDLSKGWTKAAMVYAAITIPGYIISIYGVKERFKPVKEDGPKVTIAESLKCLAHNLPAWMIILAHLAWGVSNGFGGAARNYFWTYVYEDVSLISSTGWFSSAGMILAAFLAMILVGKVKNKRNIPLVAWAVSGVSQIIAAVLPVGPNMILPLEILLLISSCAGQVGFITLFGIAPDVTEHSQKVHGLRNAGFIFAAINLAFQLGNALTSGIYVMVLGQLGYVAGQAQNAAVLGLIKYGTWLLPGAAMILGTFCWVGYKLNEQTHNEAIHQLSK